MQVTCKSHASHYPIMGAVDPSSFSLYPLLAFTAACKNRNYPGNQVLNLKESLSESIGKGGINEESAEFMSLGPQRITCTWYGLNF